jgi:hypothetical protein
VPLPPEPPRPEPLPRPKPGRKKRKPRQDSSLFGRIETAFLRLPDNYPYLKVDGAAIGCGLPAQPVTPDDARRVLTDDATGYDDKDHGWRHLIAQARDADAGRGKATEPTAADWQLVALATALPGIKRHIRSKEIRRTADVDAEIICHVLAYLKQINLGRRNVCGRLINTAVQRYIRQTRPAERPIDPDDLTGQPDPQPGPADIEPGHPLVLLARLNAQGHLNRDDARLIAYTRLGPLTLKQAAHRLHISEAVATMRRLRAEAKIVQLLTGPPPNGADTGSTAAATDEPRHTSVQPPTPRAPNDQTRNDRTPNERHGPDRHPAGAEPPR